MTEHLCDHPRAVVCTCGHAFGVHDDASPRYLCKHCNGCEGYYTDWATAHALGVHPFEGDGAAVPTYHVGSLVIAARNVGPVAGGGEVGVCCEVASLAGRPSYGFLFSRGGHDSFAPNEAAFFLRPLGLTRSRAAAYRFAGVLQLVRDYRDGRFAGAFAEAVGLATAQASHARGARNAEARL